MQIFILKLHILFLLSSYLNPTIPYNNDNYQLAPEHPLPAAYEDAWEALQWAAAGPKPWLNSHAGLNTVFLADDSASANIAHNPAMRGTIEGFTRLTLQGMVLLHPNFGSDKKDNLVEFVYPSNGGLEDFKVHSQQDPKLSELGCPRMLIFLSKKNFLRERGRSYYEALKMVEFESEDHVFHLFDPTKDKSVDLVKQFVAFINQRSQL